MSELKVNKVTPRSGTTVTLGDSGDTITIPSGATITNSGTATGFGASAFRNIIINGDMSIAQRGTSTSGVTSSDYYACDRWDTNISSLGTWTISQSTDVPSGQGFANSMKWDCTTADASPSASDNIIIQQHIEGQNLQYLKKGTSSAESITFSFWIKSNKTGTYTVQLRDIDNARHISKEFTISSADTWEKKTLTFAGDTTGAFDNDNAKSLQLDIYLGAGSNFTSGTLASSWSSYTQANTAPNNVNLADNTANYINITGVQLEAGTTASDFEFLPVDVNLARCQRYYYLHASGTGKTIGAGCYFNSTEINSIVKFKQTMRTEPSISVVSGTNYYRMDRNGGQDYFDDFTIYQPSTNASMIYNATQASGTAAQAGIVNTSNASAFLAFQAEL